MHASPKRAPRVIEITPLFCGSLPPDTAGAQLRPFAGEFPGLP